jgi:effector-binding domain-containing protein
MLPGGAAATTTHRGPYGELDAAHRGIRDWCARRGRRLAGPRWEIYGHWTDNPNELETEVYYLLR